MKKILKIGGVLLILALIGGFVAYKYVYNKPHPDYENVDPVHSVQAKKLFEEYVNATEAANEKYNGQVIEITGQLDKVEQVDSLNIVVFAFSEGMFGDEGIRCTVLPKYNEKASSINTGKSITIKGLCTGYNGTDVILEKCSF